MIIFASVAGSIFVLILASEYLPKKVREGILQSNNLIILSLLPLCSAILLSLAKIREYFLGGGFYEADASYGPMELALDFTEAMGILEYGTWITIACLLAVFAGNVRKKRIEQEI